MLVFSNTFRMYFLMLLISSQTEVCIMVILAKSIKDTYNVLKEVEDGEPKSINKSMFLYSLKLTHSKCQIYKKK